MCFYIYWEYGTVPCDPVLELWKISRLWWPDDNDLSIKYYITDYCLSKIALWRMRHDTQARHTPYFHYTVPELENAQEIITDKKILKGDSCRIFHPLRSQNVFFYRTSPTYQWYTCILLYTTFISFIRVRLIKHLNKVYVAILQSNI